MTKRVYGSIIAKVKEFIRKPKVVNYFRKKASSKLFDTILNASLDYVCIYCLCKDDLHLVGASKINLLVITINE